MEEQNTQYMVDFLSITLDLEKPFVLGDKMNNTYIANNKTKNNIMFELINLGIKPPSGYSQLTEYYNNLKIYS